MSGRWGALWPLRWLGNRLERLLRRTARLSLSYVANHAARWRVPKSRRLPAQPWRIEETRSDEVIGTLPWPEQQEQGVEAIFYLDTIGTTQRRPSEPRSQRDLEISRSDDLILVPNGIALRPNGAVLRRDFRTRTAKHGALDRLPGASHVISRRGIGGAITRWIDQPVLLADARWPNVFGHLLLEVIPTLGLLD